MNMTIKTMGALAALTLLAACGDDKPMTAGTQTGGGTVAANAAS